MSAAKIAGVVFAAGASSRMGRNKLLLTLAGETLAHRMVRQVLEAGLAPVMIVVGRDAEAMREAVVDLPCRIVDNTRYEEGMSTSFKAAIAAMPEDADAAMFMLADQPFVTVDMLKQAVETYQRGEARLVVSDYDGVMAPPHLWHRDYFDELASGEGDQGAKRFINRHIEEAAILRFPGDALFDIDLPEDYERARARAEAS